MFDCETTMVDGESVYHFAKYIAQIIVDGDYMNAYLTMLPADIQAAMFEVGKWLAGSLGY